MRVKSSSLNLGSFPQRYDDVASHTLVSSFTHTTTQATQVPILDQKNRQESISEELLMRRITSDDISRDSTNSPISRARKDNKNEDSTKYDQRFILDSLRLEFVNDSKVERLFRERFFSIQTGHRHWSAFWQAVGEIFTNMTVSLICIEIVILILVMCFYSTNESRVPYLQQVTNCTSSVSSSSGAMQECFVVRYFDQVVGYVTTHGIVVCLLFVLIAIAKIKRLRDIMQARGAMLWQIIAPLILTTSAFVCLYGHFVAFRKKDPSYDDDNILPVPMVTMDFLVQFYSILLVLSCNSGILFWRVRVSLSLFFFFHFMLLSSYSLSSPLFISFFSFPVQVLWANLACSIAMMGFQFFGDQWLNQSVNRNEQGSMAMHMWLLINSFLTVLSYRNELQLRIAFIQTKRLEESNMEVAVQMKSLENPFTVARIQEYVGMRSQRVTTDNNNEEDLNAADDVMSASSRSASGLKLMLMEGVGDWALEYDRLRFDGKIARGGGGIVWKGRYFQQKVAIKQVFAGRNSKNSILGGSLEQFANEVSVLHRLNSGASHPNLLRLYGICKNDTNDLFFVMEFCDCSVHDILIGATRAMFGIRKSSSGGDYSSKNQEEEEEEKENEQSKIDNTMLECGLHSNTALKTLRNCIVQTANAMSFLHERNIAHRDLKPQNLLVKRYRTFSLFPFF